MYEVNQIEKILAHVVTAIKDKPDDKRIPIEDGRTYVKETLPEYHPLYALTVEWMNRIRIHVEKGVFPEELFVYRSPNQTEKEFDYTKNNYKQATLPVSVDYLNTIRRCFHDANWGIQYQEEDSAFVNTDTTFEKYVTEGIFHYGSVENYVKNFLPQPKTIDANGYVAVKPLTVSFVVDDDGNSVQSGDMVDPVPVYYSSDQVVSYLDSEYVMFLTDMKSIVTVGSKPEHTGLIFEFYDDVNIWRIEQTGVKSEYTFDIVLYYTHNWARVPCERLKGNPIEIDGQTVQQSPYLSVTDVLDEVILDSQNLMAVKATCVYPYRIMTGDVCDFKMKINDVIETCNGRGTFYDEVTEKSITCSNCDGTGLKNRMSPTGVLLLRPETITSKGDTSMPTPGLTYVSPSIDTPQFLRDEIRNNINSARQILHLTTTNTEVRGSEKLTATQAALDMKALYAFVKPISDQLFGLYEFILDAIGWMRYGERYRKPSLKYPQQFDFYTEADYLKQISEGIDNGLPPFIVSASVRNYIESVMMQDARQGMIYKLIVHADRLLHMEKEEIEDKQRSGLVAGWEVVLHDSALPFINDLIRENKDFLELDFDKQIEQLVEKAKSVYAESESERSEQRLAFLRKIDESDEDGENAA